MQALRPLISYAVRMPPKLEDKGDHEVENHHHKIEFCDGRSWYVMLRFGDMPDPGEYMGEIDRELTGPLHPRGAVESEVLSLQAMKKAGVELVPSAYLPRFEGGMYTGEYIHSGEGPSIRRERAKVCSNRKGQRPFLRGCHARFPVLTGPLPACPMSQDLEDPHRPDQSQDPAGVLDQILRRSSDSAVETPIRYHVPTRVFSRRRSRRRTDS
jgi:hypothetical protein